MRPLLASLFDSLDGVTYFFVSSAVFVLVPAVLFFSLGLWIGALTWGRFKRHFRAAQETIEDMKNELALLKRRTAEMASRALPQQPGQARAVSRAPLTAPVRPASMPPPPPSAAFTKWTEPGWTLQETPATPDHSSVAAAGTSPVKSILEFPKAGAGTPTFGDWLHFENWGSKNGDSPAEAFRAELSAGIARNDYLLGIVFTTPPAQRDDLSKLDGISASECAALEAYGVHSFKQIGLWDRHHADEFARRLGLKDKARAAKWIDQAVRLHQETGGQAS